MIKMYSTENPTKESQQGYLAFNNFWLVLLFLLVGLSVIIFLKVPFQLIKPQIPVISVILFFEILFVITYLKPTYVEGKQSNPKKENIQIEYQSLLDSKAQRGAQIHTAFSILIVGSIIALSPLSSAQPNIAENRLKPWINQTRLSVFNS